jgi:hypothetical protein
MQELPQAIKSRPYKRSPLLVAAYCTLTGAIINLILGTGMYWIAGSAGLAVLLGLAEIVVQVRRRSASA